MANLCYKSGTNSYTVSNALNSSIAGKKHLCFSSNNGTTRYPLTPANDRPNICFSTSYYSWASRTYTKTSLVSSNSNNTISWADRCLTYTTKNPDTDKTITTTSSYASGTTTKLYINKSVSHTYNTSYTKTMLESATSESYRVFSKTYLSCLGTVSSAKVTYPEIVEYSIATGATLQFTLTASTLTAQRVGGVNKSTIVINNWNITSLGSCGIGGTKTQLIYTAKKTLSSTIPIGTRSIAYFGNEESALSKAGPGDYFTATSTYMVFGSAISTSNFTTKSATYEGFYYASTSGDILDTVYRGIEIAKGVTTNSAYNINTSLKTLYTDTINGVCIKETITRAGHAEVKTAASSTTITVQSDYAIERTDSAATCKFTANATQNVLASKTTTVPVTLGFYPKNTTSILSTFNTIGTMTFTNITRITAYASTSADTWLYSTAGVASSNALVLYSATGLVVNFANKQDYKGINWIQSTILNSSTTNPSGRYTFTFTNSLYYSNNFYSTLSKSGSKTLFVSQTLNGSSFSSCNTR